MDWGSDVVDAGVDAWNGMNTLQKASMVPVPIASDIAGVLGDIQMYSEQPDTRGLLNYGMTAASLLPGIPSVAGATAWHGSPHKWDKVDLDKVGTGEGAQAYGHGFYSAQSPDVALEYKDGLSRLEIDPDSVTAEGKTPTQWFDYTQKQSYGAKNATPHHEKMGMLQNLQLGEHPSSIMKTAREDGLSAESIDWFNNKFGDKFDEVGNMYELDIDDQAIGSMLDWDNTIGAQSSKLQELAREAGVDANKTGGEFYRQLAFGNEPTMAASRGQEAASRLLNDRGIPGIRYLDGNSRGANKGTSNYVNFDANDVNVVSRNGDPIPDEGLLGIKPEKGPDSFSGNGLLGRSDDADTFDYPPAENAGKTQIAGTKPTYEKAAKILDESAPKGKSIDYGAGLGVGAGAIKYDTFEPFPKTGFKPNFTSPEKIPSDTYSRLTNLNVLNVVPKEARDSIVKDIGRVLKPKGQAIITTRGADVMKAKGKAGPEPTSIITTIGTYQKGFKRGELVEYLKETLGNGFDVEPLGLGPAGAKITKKGN